MRHHRSPDFGRCAPSQCCELAANSHVSSSQTRTLNKWMLMVHADLVGFFSSLPQQAWQEAVQCYLVLRGRSMDTTASNDCTGVLSWFWGAIIFKQVGGATIGSQLPLLYAPYPSLIASKHLAPHKFAWCGTRYVDNRLLFLYGTIANTPLMRFLRRQDFYIGPVLLEAVNDLHYLGLNIFSSSATFDLLYTAR